MWKAEQIELINNAEIFPKGVAVFDDCATLKINGVRISNRCKRDLGVRSLNNFQASVCDECGEEGCDPTGFLALRKKGKELYFIPTFEWITEWKEYDEGNGDSQCPPHEWFEKGMLVLDEEYAKKLFELLPGLSYEVIETLDEIEEVCIKNWEFEVSVKWEAIRSSCNEDVRFTMMRLAIYAREEMKIFDNDLISRSGLILNVSSSDFDELFGIHSDVAITCSTKKNGLANEFIERSCFLDFRYNHVQKSCFVQEVLFDDQNDIHISEDEIEYEQCKILIEAFFIKLFFSLKEVESIKVSRQGRALFAELRTEFPDEKLCRLLLMSGANVNGIDTQYESGDSILQVALDNRNIDENIIEMLLDFGADPNYSIEGLNSLFTAMLQQPNRIVHLLIERGANVNCQSTGIRESLLDWAIFEHSHLEDESTDEEVERMREAVEILKRFGAKRWDDLNK